VKKDKNDIPGPVSLGVAVEAEKTSAKKPEAGSGADATPAKDTDKTPGKDETAAASGSTTRLVVYGDSDFATNGQLANVGNATLLANTFNWLVKRESLVTIPQRNQNRFASTSPRRSSVESPGWCW